MTSPESLRMEIERSKWTFMLAIIVITAFFILYASALVSGILASPKDYSGIEMFASTLGPIVATVIGFYFGQRPVQSLAEQVQDVAAKKEKVRETLEDVSDKTAQQKSEINEQIQDLEAQVMTKDEIISRLSRELEQLRQRQQ